jgi:hypothetical protein
MRNSACIAGLIFAAMVSSCDGTATLIGRPDETPAVSTTPTPVAIGSNPNITATTFEWRGDGPTPDSSPMVDGGLNDAENDGGIVFPDTGQALCYDNLAPIICPSAGQPFYGQDAQQGSNTMRFTDHGDGTVTHESTGLMWQKANEATKLSWQGALDYCANLVLAGHADWRLPDAIELQSIVDYGRFVPAIDPTYFPGTSPDSYWSSSALASNINNAVSVAFLYGHVGNKSKTDIYDARCVRP